MELICIGCDGRSRSIGSLHACSTRPSPCATVGSSKAAMRSRCDSTWRGSTKDLDLTVRTRGGDSSALRERLQLAASIELPDFLTFIVGEAMAELNQAPEGGARFPVDARLDGRTFV